MKFQRFVRQFGIGATILVLAASLGAVNALAQAENSAAGQSRQGGTVMGRVTVGRARAGLHNATVLLSPLGQVRATDELGRYAFQNVPPGHYDIIARAPALADERRPADVTEGGTVTIDFNLRPAALREQVTVTASGHEQSTLSAFQAVNVVDSIALTQKPPVSLGDALDGTSGVAKRSFGPGNSRPVIRGFDGDRVLIMQDGIPTGSLSSQSGDHGELLNTLTLDRLEVVKGPATLLYGSSAIGGVVNAVSTHGEAHGHRREETTGYITGTAGSTNGLGGGAAGLEYGVGSWQIWGDGGGQRTGDYSTPIGEVSNSFTRDANGSAGFGYAGEHAFVRAGGGYQHTEYGIPPSGEEIVALHLRRANGRIETGLQDLNSQVSGFRLKLDYSDYRHDETPLGATEADTRFFNQIFSYRGVFEERPGGLLSGSFGFSGMRRDYRTVGEEAIAPPADMNNFSVFTLQEVGLKRVRVQFGARLDHTSYDVSTDSGYPNRSFTGLSGAAGAHLPLWQGGVFVANYTHSYRAPSLEELYNHGPHPGNATFEIGNPNLRREQGDGLDLSLRQESRRLRTIFNFFYYHIDHFVFLAPTGEVEDGLPVADYAQGNSRFLGGEASLSLGLAGDVRLNTGLDFVDAQLTDTDTPLPRIPPLRGRIGLEYQWHGLSLRPEAVMARDQDELFPTETRTAGYTVFNLEASYTVAQEHSVHVFSVSAFNLGNRLYRNHLSFIKEIAPEIGRGVRASYTVRFF
ncbi:MAG: TonB-dependent receptor [Acidobacteriota bacterium]